MGSDADDQRAAAVAAMPLARKVRAMSGSLPLWRGMLRLSRGDLYHARPFPAAELSELGLPGLHFADGPRGVVLEGGATTFPVPMARGATWDVELERRVGDAIGRELRALGGTLFGGVCVNLLRHPAWGRAQETFGEDPVHVGAMGAALVEGVQRHALACVKHFVANSVENARFHVDVELDARAMHEVYLPAFEACVGAGVAAVMTAYNAVNGEWCGQHRDLIEGVLRERWGFDGVVLTDFVFGVRDAAKALEAGLDLEMPFPMVWGDRLLRLARRGDVDVASIDRAVERLSRVQARLPEASGYGRDDLGTPDHQALAREVAGRAITLLQNRDGLLPLTAPERVVVLGRLADVPNLGDRGSSDGRPPYVVTPLEGLRAVWGDRVVHHVSLDEPGARDAVAAADAVVAVVGYTHEDEGEHIEPPDLSAFVPLMPPPVGLRRAVGLPGAGAMWRAVVGAMMRHEASQMTGEDRSFGKGGDRTRLTLRPEDEALLLDAAELSPGVVACVMGGSAIVMERWRHRVGALLMLWYPGQEGGHALADVLTGARPPSGRLPFAVPTDGAHLPPFDPDARHAVYDLWHGQRLLDRDGHTPAFPFGFGLSYSTFELSDLRVDEPSLSYTALDHIVRARVRVSNTGLVASACVVQLYGEPPASVVERPARLLVGFARVDLAPGESLDLAVPFPARRLAVFDPETDAFALPLGAYRLVAAQHAGDSGAASSVVVGTPG